LTRKADRQDPFWRVRLEDLFAKVLRVSAEKLSDDSSPDSLKKWNSFNHLQLIVAMEEAYGVKFTTSEIESVKTLGMAKEMLRRKGADL
jgi:acyl carrier protein